jgi:hypothetical protein
VSSGATTTSVTMIDSRCAHRVVATAVELAEAKEKKKKIKKKKKQ